MGKSTVAQMFAEAGIPVFDADAEVRAMQGPGGELIPAIEAAFPGSTGPEGVDRDRLGHQVFADTAALARLEAIVHPAVAAKRAAFLARHHDKPAVVFESLFSLFSLIPIIVGLVFGGIGVAMVSSTWPGREREVRLDYDHEDAE